MLWWLAGLTIGGYLLVCAAMFGLQRHLLYHPGSRDVALDVDMVPGAMVQELATADGETLKSWWVPPRTAQSPVYLYLQGNAQTLLDRAERFEFLVQEGAGLLAISWRGYGGSSGHPTESGLRVDAETAYQWLTTRVDPSRVILFGESLGTGLAVALAAQRPSAALVLDSAYGSIESVASEEYPWLPVRLLLRDHFNSLALAPRVMVPVRAMHCGEDPLVPYRQAKTLLAALGSTDKKLITVPGRCHVPSVLPLADELRALERIIETAQR